MNRESLRKHCELTCKMFNHGRTTSRTYAEHRFILDLLEQTEWIPVSERLPKDHENVLIYLSSNQIAIGLYNSHKLPFMDKPIGWGADASHGWSSDDVVAWMPLPEPYKPTDSEKE